MNIKQEKGITLTVLVTTIIVLLIIAGIGINYGRDTIQKAHLEELETNMLLIKAKANPKEYENLIVRVWGFSAYFNDLPESYKDLLIERALKNEGKSY